MLYPAELRKHVKLLIGVMPQMWNALGSLRRRTLYPAELRKQTYQVIMPRSGGFVKVLGAAGKGGKGVFRLKFHA